MPPEPFPFDRKDFFRERKHQQHHGHDPVARWRDPSLSSYGGSRTPNDFSPRWGFPSDFRRLPGHGKQGGWYEYPEDFPHGYSRYGDRFVDDEGFRPSVPRGDGRYGRVYRENRTPFRQREWRSHSSEANHHQSVPRNASGRPHCMNDMKSPHVVNDQMSPHVVNDQKSPHVAKDQKSPHVAKDQKSPHVAKDQKSPHVANDQKSPHVVHNQKSPLCVKDQKSVVNSPIRASHPHSDPGDQLRSKEKAVKTSNVSGPGTGQKIDKEDALGVLDWKPVKWSRSGSLTSRCSGFSHSSSAKSIAGESNGVKSFLPGKKVTPVQSPSGEAVTCPLSISPSDDKISRKKPRLGWGMGLAKYERQKDDGPEENDSKAGDVSPSNVEHTHSFTSNLVEKSPRIAGFSDCSSPATPSSVACSSSQGLEDKAYGRTLGADVDPNNFCMTSMVAVPENQHEGLHYILEKLVLNSITDLSSLISELLQADKQCSMDSCFKRSSTLNKLLLWKDDISKSLEITETEIDSLENELKSLSSDCGSNSPCLVALGSLSADCKDEIHEDLNVFQRPPALEVVSSKDMEGRETLPCDDGRGSHTENKDEVVDSPGTAASEFLEPLGVQKRLAGDSLEQCSKEIGLVESTKGGMQGFVKLVDVENTLETSCHGGKRKMVHDDCVLSSCENFSLRDQRVNSICDSIFAYNKDSAASASEVLDKLLPSGNYCFDTTEVNTGSILPDELTITDKFLRKKRLVRFKESVLSLKYRAFQHLWKEDLRLLSLKNNRTKSQKKIDHSTRATLYGFQKHRSSIRSRFTSPAGSLSLVPTTEMVRFTSKMLSDPQLKTYRDSLKMPAMFLDEKERSASRFLSNNGLVEDPCALEKERALINPWTNEEKEIFIDKLATLGKDFGKIAFFLDHKTTADCVDFYYKNHKSECFEKTKKKQGKPLSTTTYLVTTSDKKWSREREMNVAYLDILGAASVIAAQAEEAIEPSKASSGKSSIQKSSEDERETAAADVLAGICGSLSSEAMGSCITSSVDPKERNQDLEDGKVTQKVDNDDGDRYSNESCGEMDPVDWTDDDKSLFVEAFSSYGNDFTMISRVVRTKSRDQCRVFFSKARKCLGLDSSPNDSDIHGTSEETCSVVCSDKSGSRIDEELPCVIQDVSKPEAMVTDMNTLDDNCSAEKTVCKDNILRSELRRVIQDDPSKADASIGVVDIERGKLENDVVNSLIVLVGPREGRYQQSTATGGDASKLDLSLKADANRVIPRKVGSEAKAQSFADTFLRKCHRKQPLQDADTVLLPVLSKNKELETEKPCRNGKVKLFGKILSTPEIPTCSAQINDISIHEHNNPTGLENVPIRSYGFWDGTKIQTGFSSMQNSALLLAKYPAAVGNSLFPEAEQSECIVKQKQDTFPEAKSNNFERIPRLQDGGEVVVGDTVAALKIQYMVEPLNQHQQYVVGMK